MKSEKINTANWLISKANPLPAVGSSLAGHHAIPPVPSCHSKWRGFYIIFLEACLKTKAVFWGSNVDGQISGKPGDIGITVSWKILSITDVETSPLVTARFLSIDSVIALTLRHLQAMKHCQNQGFWQSPKVVQKPIKVCSPKFDVLKTWPVFSESDLFKNWNIPPTQLNPYLFSTFSCRTSTNLIISLYTPKVWKMEPENGTLE